MNMTLDFARPRIMPRIQPDSIFEHLAREMVAHVPFVYLLVISAIVHVIAVHAY